LHISAFGKSSTEYPQSNMLHPSSYVQAGDQRLVADYPLTLLFLIDDSAH